MLNEKRPLLVAVVSIVFLASLSIVFKGRGQTELKQSSAGVPSQTQSDQNAKQLDDAATPIVDLANPDTTDRIDKNARKLKNARHDKSGPVKIDSYSNAGEVRSDPEHRAGFSDLPVDKSDIIVEAVVGDSKAFLSEDRTGIYSEFTIIVSKILKVAAGFSINLGDKIVTERFGGKVRFPTGEIVRWRESRQGVPITGKKYLFFLARADQDSYKLLTAYEMQGNKVFPLDGSRTEPGRPGASVFDKHNGEDLDIFMQEVQNAISRSRSGTLTTRSQAAGPGVCFWSSTADQQETGLQSTAKSANIGA
jgi:hypothetical protein